MLRLENFTADGPCCNLTIRQFDDITPCCNLTISWQMNMLPFDDFTADWHAVRFHHYTGRSADHRIEPFPGFHELPRLSLHILHCFHFSSFGFQLFFVNHFFSFYFRTFFFRVNFGDRQTNKQASKLSLPIEKSKARLKLRSSDSVFLRAYFFDIYYQGPAGPDPAGGPARPVQ